MGLADLDGRNGVEHGSQVSEEQLQNMLGLNGSSTSVSPSYSTSTLTSSRDKVKPAV